jgi:hypothetical protein
VTPFDTFFDSHFGPALKGAPPAAKKAARESAAQIWNAALDAAEKTSPGPGVMEEPLKFDNLRARADA